MISNASQLYPAVKILFFKAIISDKNKLVNMSSMIFNKAKSTILK